MPGGDIKLKDPDDEKPFAIFVEKDKWTFYQYEKRYDKTGTLIGQPILIKTDRMTDSSDGKDRIVVQLCCEKPKKFFRFLVWVS